VSDVATVWEELTMTILTFRRAEDSVIGFGRVEGQRPGQRMLASLMWVVRLRDGKIGSIEVFQAAGEIALSASQRRRLETGTAAADPPAGTGAALQACR
jgi:ketosteroid isomerase-like protein